MFSHDRRWLAIDGRCTLQVDSGHRNLGVISSSIFDTTNAKKDIFAHAQHRNM